MTANFSKVLHLQLAPGTAAEAPDQAVRPSPLKHFFSCCRSAAIAGLLPLLLAGIAGPSHAQQDFSTSEAAAVAFADALATNNPDALRTVLGADWRRYIPTDGVDMDDVYAFLAGWAKSHKILTDSPSTAHLAIGESDWTLPIPIVKRGDSWRFDTRAGGDEIRTRRIGSNELAAIQAALAYYDAQKDYALVDRNGDGVLEYAQRVVSTPGKNDGLYWAALAGEPDSPLGPLFGDDRPGDDYHGYYFRILKAQGPNAPGGAYDYRINGRMVSGFALVAWPVKYGDTGVMTFMVSHDGKLYERDLGPGTDAAARAVTRFDPGPAWQAVSP
jgi:Protein of unknown function (DUF2950)